MKSNNIGTPKNKIKKAAYRIAVLAWAGLDKTAKGLKLASPFKKTDLELKLETTRIAKSNNRLCLVIDAKYGRANRVFCAISKHKNLEAAAKEFIKVEHVGNSRIGIVDVKNKIASESLERESFGNESLNVYNWAKKNKFDGVIFSALGRRWADAGLDGNFSVQGAGKYIENAPNATQKLCVDYLKAIDKSITTPFLDAFRLNMNPAKKKKVGFVSVKKIAKAV